MIAVVLYSERTRAAQVLGVPERGGNTGTARTGSKICMQLLLCQCLSDQGHCSCSHDCFVFLKLSLVHVEATNGISEYSPGPACLSTLRYALVILQLLADHANPGIVGRCCTGQDSHIIPMNTRTSLLKIKTIFYSLTQSDNLHVALFGEKANTKPKGKSLQIRTVFCRRTSHRGFRCLSGRFVPIHRFIFAGAFQSRLDVFGVHRSLTSEWTLATVNRKLFGELSTQKKISYTNRTYLIF